MAATATATAPEGGPQAGFPAGRPGHLVDVGSWLNLDWAECGRKRNRCTPFWSRHLFKSTTFHLWSLGSSSPCRLLFFVAPLLAILIPHILVVPTSPPLEIQRVSPVVAVLRAPERLSHIRFSSHL